jgi:hypothetical protein
MRSVSSLACARDTHFVYEKGAGHARQRTLARDR